MANWQYLLVKENLSGIQMIDLFSKIRGKSSVLKFLYVFESGLFLQKLYLEMLLKVPLYFLIRHRKRRPCHFGLVIFKGLKQQLGACMAELQHPVNILFPLIGR